MTRYAIAMIEGDGIGPEISRASLSVIESLKTRFGLEFEIRPSPAGDACKKNTGQALPDGSIATIEGSDACLKAPVGDTAADVIVKLRQMLSLYANIRPSKALPHVPSLRPDIDFVIVRENTECLYRGMEFEFDGGVVALRTITRKASERIAEHAFKLAELRNKSRKVVAVHKSNVLRKSDGLFAQTCKDGLAGADASQLLALLIQRHSFTNQAFQCTLVNGVTFSDVDRTPDVPAKAGVEQA